MASTPASPQSLMAVPKLTLPSRERIPSLPSPIDSHHESDASQPAPASEGQSQEATVEAKLGRKRCIMFACGKRDDKAEQKPAPPLTAEPEQISEKPVEKKRPCTIKFACPFNPTSTSQSGDLVASNKAPARLLSPAPKTTTPTSPTSFGTRRRNHRDSDTTIRNPSPSTPKALPEQGPGKMARRMSSSSDIFRSDACRFHEFASEEEEVDDWTRMSTCHRTRLTVDDTLKKEMDIRKLVEEADEEEALDEELNTGYGGTVFDDDDDSSDAGFASDDEDGFAESDDDDAADSDYEWWAPNRSRAASPYVAGDVFRPTPTRTYSDSSIDSDNDQASTIDRRRSHRNKRLKPVPIRPGTPELPDSTDFVCGTLDEDRPLEQAYLSCLEQRKAAKHRAVPQDIDPSFPVSDPELGSDDDDDDDDEHDKPARGRSERAAGSGRGTQDDESGDEEPRGRRMKSPATSIAITTPVRPVRESPKRLRSPAIRKVVLAHSPPPQKSILMNRSPPPAKKKSCASHRSPAPRALFLDRSPQRLRSPNPAHRMTSPPPSRRGSMTMTRSANVNVPFIGARNDDLTHTASLPRSSAILRASKRAVDAEDDDEDDDGSETDKPSDHVTSAVYTRGAIDIAQGLEKKRLKRRELFYKQYQRKEGKKERHGRSRRPQPGKGAERMRQVGLDCAVYRGTRMLSI